MRSGRETGILVIIVVATITAWIMALALNLKPVDFQLLKSLSDYIYYCDY